MSESNSESNSKSNSESNSGVYKSKLFNFLNRRSQQLMDQSKTVLRHLQVATTWGIQIALYPVYLLIQTTRNFAFQLQEAAAKKEARSLGQEVDNQPILPPRVDQPITQTLELVKEFFPDLLSQTLVLGASSSSSSNNNSAYLPYQLPAQLEQDSTLILSNDIRSASPVLSQVSGGKQDNLSTFLPGGEEELVKVGLFIQGVANLITSRKLVLVGNNNQIFDILTPEQQQKLAKKITWEVASYGYDRRRFLQSQKIISPQLPGFQSPRTLLPAKWFWKLMGWVQKGEVAIAANLFQESSLAVVNSSNNSSNNSSSNSSNNLFDNLLIKLLERFSNINFSSLPLATSTLQVVDQQVYEIEIKQITPASQWLSHLGEKLLPFVIYPEQVLSRYQAQETTHLDPNYKQNIQEHSSANIWALIQGAIAYFFGQKSSPEISPTQSHNQSNYSLNGSVPRLTYPAINSSLIYQELTFFENDWLTSEDLFKTPLLPIHSYEDEDMIDLPSIGETKLLSQTNNPSLAQVMAHQKNRNKPPALISSTQRNKINRIEKSTGRNSRAIEKKSLDSKPTKSSKTTSSIYRDVEYGMTNYCDLPTELDNNNNDWIETEVTSQGYVKHPLQKCLEILDSITLWIEEFFVGIWRLIKRIAKV